jgi:hydroxyacylglutathione hydrolase
VRIFEHRAVGPLACNCYVVGDPVTKHAIVLDPGGNAEDLMEVIAAQGIVVDAIVATHAHFDHIVAAEHVRRATGAPFFMHAADKPLLDWFQESGRMFLGLDLGAPPEVDRDAPEGMKLVAGSASLEVLHTPGHSPGSISLVGEGIVFAGDTLFAGSIGRTDLPGGDTQALLDGVQQKLFPLGDDVIVYPGHGPRTTLGEERVSNPFVGQGA